MPKAPPIGKEKKGAMEALYGVVNPETGSEYTLEQISAKTQVPVSTVGYYRKKWEKRQKESQALEADLTPSDPLELFESVLSKVPGIGEAKVEYAMEMLRLDQSILTNPTDLWRFLTQKPLELKGIAPELVMKAMFGNQVVQSGGSGSAPFVLGGQQSAPPPFVLGGPPMSPYGPMGGHQPQQMQFLGHGPQGPVYGYPPQPPWASMQSPPYYPPQPPAPPGVTKEDVAQIVAQALAQHAPQQQPSGEYEEVQEPVLDAHGQPVMGPDGPLLRFRRVPIGHRDAPAPLDPLTLLRTAKDILKPDTPATAAPSAELQELREAVRALKDKEGSSTQAALADLKAEFAGERARREAAEKHAAEMSRMQDQLRAAEVRAVNTGLPPDAQILKGGIDTVDKHANTVLTNMDKRMGRMENLITKVLFPPPAGVALPVDAATVAELEARQRAVDEAEAAARAPPAEAPQEAVAAPETETPKAPAAPAEGGAPDDGQ